MKTVDFSETIAACDLRVGRCRQLFAFYSRYVSILVQCHILTLAQDLHIKMKLDFLIFYQILYETF